MNQARRFRSTSNLTRKEALSLVGIEHDLDGTIVALERETDERPLLVVTSARPSADGVGYDLRARLETPTPRS